MLLLIKTIVFYDSKVGAVEKKHAHSAAECSVLSAWITRAKHHVDIVFKASGEVPDTTWIVLFRQAASGGSGGPAGPSAAEVLDSGGFRRILGRIWVEI